MLGAWTLPHNIPASAVGIAVLSCDLLQIIPLLFQQLCCCLG